jgi:O-antigen/teichoic acid export membrane protein
MLAKLKSLQNHQGFMKYFKNTSWLFAEKVLRMTVGLFVGIWVARYLGPEEFGLFSYAQSFVGLFTAVAALGLDGIVVRELVKDESRRDELIGTAFVLKLIGAFIMLIVLAASIKFTSNDDYANLLIFVIASAVIFQSFNVIDIYFQAKVLSKYVVFANMISLFASSIFKILLILNEAPLIAFAWVVLFDSVVLALGFIYFLLKNSTFSFQKIHFKKETAFLLLKDSLFYMFSAIVISLYMKIDQVMIKEMLGSKDVGYYAVAVRLSEFWYFLPIIISNSLYPAIENAKKQSQELYYKRLEKLFIVCNLIALTIVVPTLFLSDFIVKTLYGNAYIASGSVLAIHIISLIFAFQRIPSEYWVLSENLKYFEIFKTMIGLIVNIILNFILIKEYGINGAAAATLVSMFVAGYISYAFYEKSIVIFKIMTKTLFLININKVIKERK